MIFTVTDSNPNPPIPYPALPKLLTLLYRSEFCSLSKTELSSRCPDVLEEIHVTLEEATHLEKLTRKQSLCTQWHTHWAGRLTASNFYDIGHTSPQTPSATVIRRTMDYLPIVQTAAITWGENKRGNCNSGKPELDAEAQSRICCSTKWSCDQPCITNTRSNPSWCYRVSMLW